ncbi:MAG TPA: hypothetical protein VGN64_04480, partial [Dyadobacter sp.]|nr:hypothetical protein [Dyadobacter sp.]
KNILTMLGLLSCLMACNGGSENPGEAAEKLTAVKEWKISQIYIDDVQSLKDGKIVSRFGGVDFERYMETVQFKPDGKFEGVFKGETTPFALKWAKTDKLIEVSADGQKGGAWSVAPAGVSAKKFTMSTSSTAYDYPRTTKIALEFRAED